MNNKKRGYSLVSFAVLGLMYNIYYFAMRNTAGVLNNLDKIVCLFTSTIFIIIIIYNIIKRVKTKGR